ncbi:hypothetical protein ANOBCDAF_00742 [Pleomorphomonas sp. T1.2MG-36]|uniref:hypothetical protein n=1 Tax=Pleomorphomonas sp. T1.2MG-36 TaxID=3041167 RepID=UPI0024777ABE|nr:hypothetical protein [Pleomorphomonas sp. T1.2MG-36]CAI9401649.1 hypothetical protein ANOBCDAF_00742 [Pleomorphomonas sp. T1.2MG-36]
MRPELSETLAFLAGIAERAGVEPVLFGTGVLELRGIGDFHATDLDVILGVEEARAMAAAAGVDPGEESGNDRFRSRVHVHLGGAPLVIDVMADMSIRAPDGWVLYELAEIADIDAVGRRFRAASLADLRRFYRLAGRAKDAAKIAALDAAMA